jgi:hypothetical protein
MDSSEQFRRPGLRLAEIKKGAGFIRAFFFERFSKG